MFIEKTPEGYVIRHVNGGTHWRVYTSELRAKYALAQLSAGLIQFETVPAPTARGNGLEWY